MRDWRWQANGGVLLDGTGDMALSGADGRESLYDMVRTRLKAAVNGWKLYQIGAGLQERIGDPMGVELEMALKRQVARALTAEFLPKGAFQTEVISTGELITIFVYVNKSLVAQALLANDGTVTVE